MAPKRRPEINDENIQGAKYLTRFLHVLEPLQSAGTERDRAGNRTLFFDHLIGLLLLYFYTPILTSLRGLQQASTLKKVQKVLGCSRASLGSLSEASRVFDAELLADVITELLHEIRPVDLHGLKPEEQKALEKLKAVDGTLLPALPRMAWALWTKQKRAAKAHVVFDVFRWAPVKLTITEGNGNEKTELRRMLEANNLYVFDRGYAQYSLFQKIIDADSSFIGRVRNNAVWEVIEERPVTDAAKAVGVEKDLVVRLGDSKTRDALEKPVRLVFVRPNLVDTRNEETLILCTDRMDLDADLVAIGYRLRWQVELYFRWFKCVLGCKHLLSEDPNGVAMQVYVAVIAGLLLSLWTGRKPNKRTFEMIGLHQAGWADDEELTAHINGLPASVK
jgi:hypothetical protein